MKDEWFLAVLMVAILIVAYVLFAPVHDFWGTR